MYDMINDGLELAVTGAPIAAEVGAWMAVTGAIGMLFTLLACALDIEIAVIDGEMIYGGCGGLALNLYYGLKDLASGNPFNQGPPHRPLIPIAGGAGPLTGPPPVPFGTCLGPADGTDLQSYLEREAAAAEATGTDKPNGFGNWRANPAGVDAVGNAYVGAGYTVHRGGILISADRHRQYRPPSIKVTRSKTQANFDARAGTSGMWYASGHIDPDGGCP